MSFQAYLDTIEDKTGPTPRQLVAIAASKGFTDPETKAGDVVLWLKEDYDLGRGHVMALWHVIKNGPGIGTKHIGATGSHRDGSDTLRLDGKATRPTPWTTPSARRTRVGDGITPPAADDLDAAALRAYR